MSTPGSNILKTALRVIASQKIQYLAFQSRSNNAIGMLVPVYAPAITIKGSVQPVPRSIMERLGLDFTKRYVNIFAPQNFVDVTRDVSGDRFQLGSKTYQGLTLTQWFYVDGWVEILAVEVPSA